MHGTVPLASCPLPIVSGGYPSSSRIKHLTNRRKIDDVKGYVWCRQNALSSQAGETSGEVFGSISDVPCDVIDVHVGTETMPILIVDCDYVMERYIQAGMEDRDPYWTCIWPSSQVLAAAVLGQGGVDNIVRGKRVADFGAGLGLAGVAAALAHAKEVVFLDREPLALECCLVNAHLNGCLSVDSNAAVLPSLVESIMKQQTVSHHNISSSPISKIQTQLFDWNEQVQGSNLHGFDVILVCDCLYERFSVEPIARVLPFLLKEKDGVILLADPPNRAKENRDKFLGLMACYGFQVEQELVMTTLERHQGSTREVPIVFMVLSR